jgi:DNA primase
MAGGDRVNADLAAVCAAIRNRFPVSAVASRAGVNLQRAGREWKACCPFHEDRSPSFTIYADDRRFICFGCGKEGDVLDFVRLAYCVGLIQAIAMLDGGALAALEQPVAQPKLRKDWSKLAASMWRDANPIAGTPAEAYLRGRGLILDLPLSLRFAYLTAPKDSGVAAANGSGPLPALVGLVTGVDDRVAGVQRTYLTEDGRKAASADGKVKFSLGNVAGGAIRLGPVSASLIVTEGLEDGLTLAQALGRSVWVAAGTAMMPRMVLPDEVRAVVIGADGDAAGEHAAQKAAVTFSAAGRRVRIMRPELPHKDFNAQLMGAHS